MKVFWVAAISAFSITAVLGQNNYDNMPKVFASEIVVEIQDYVSKNSKISVTALTEFANQRLAARGFDFSVDPCDMKTTPTKIKFPDGYDNEVFHVYNAVGIAGRSTSFMAREPGDAPCGCHLDLPIKAITPKRMILVSEKSDLSVKPPAKFLFEEVYLVDFTLRKTSRTWLAPNGGPPDGISTDGTKLYIDIEDTPLALELPLEGPLKFVAKNSSNIIKNFTDLKKFPRDRNNAYLGFRRFTNGKRTFTVKFSHVCT